MIDSHCHLADLDFAGDLGEVVARARTSGVVGCLCILSADEPAELARVPEVRATWSAVQFAAGIHPHRSGAYADRVPDVAPIVSLALEQSGAVALGEIGLDYHYDTAPRDVQRQVFRAQVALALDRDLPIVIHTRQAEAETVAILAEAGPQLRSVLHCFTGTVDEARAAVDVGAYISISGIATFPKAGALREVAAFVPADRLLIETDAPYLAPVPNRGKRNEPAWIAETYRVVAEARGVRVDALATLVSENFMRFVAPRRTPTSR